MGLHQDKDQKRYLTILADGKLHERVDEDTEGAKVRTKKNQDGTTEEVTDKDDNLIYELTYPGITANVGKIQISEGDYGSNLNIDLTDEDDNQFVLSLKCDSPYGENFMQRLPNLDLNEPVVFKPYAFKPKGSDQKQRGLTLLQGEPKSEEKVANAFEKVEENGDREVLIKGFPMPDPKKKYNSEKWKIFFATRREWVMDYLVEAEMILPADASAPEKEDEDTEEPEEEVQAKPKKKGKKGDDDDDF